MQRGFTDRWRSLPGFRVVGSEASITEPLINQGPRSGNSNRADAFRELAEAMGDVDVAISALEDFLRTAKWDDRLETVAVRLADLKTRGQ